MKTKIIFLLVIIATVTSIEVTTESRNVQSLVIERITKVNRPNDPTGRNHSLAIRISPNVAIHDVTEWNLVLRTVTKETVTYNLKMEGTEPSLQREFVFEGNLIESDTIIMQAKKATSTVAACLLTLRLKDTGSNIAWVGAEENDPSASMRVLASESLNEIIMADHRICSLVESPCYYIMPKPKPNPRERCVDIVSGTGEIVELCDETVTSFNEITPKPDLHLHEDGKLGVQLDHSGDGKMIEVVVFDYEDRTNVYSEKGYNCYIDISTKDDDGQKQSCTHHFTQPMSQSKMMVLVVRIDDNGAVYESSLQHFDGGNRTKKQPQNYLVQRDMVFSTPRHLLLKQQNPMHVK
ncbi:hypothetical protein SK128_008294 [Halocaridina rubra]|uniref:Uncharacterized protein n=1 Tax=Halocaridina rubra TaxID=373956 RepID=A0AAN8X7F6_HALRR